MSTVAIATLLFTVLIVLLSAVVLTARSLFQPSHPVDITLNLHQRILGQTGRKLLVQLTDAGIAIPSSCAGAGTCGLCKVTVVSGGGGILPTERARLTQAECDTGVRLACQLTVRENLEITLTGDVLNAQNWLCTVVSTRNLSPLIKEIALALPDNQPIEFNPGAYVQVTSSAFSCSMADIAIDERFQESWRRLSLSALSVTGASPVTRAYSIASKPDDDGQIILLIRLALPPPGHRDDVPPGIVSSYLFSLKVGQTLKVAGPFGDFGVRTNQHNIVLIGGGVGMAPLRAIAHAQLKGGSHRRMHFFYGARSQEDLFYQQEMQDLAQQYSQFVWTVALSEPAVSDNWRGPTGFIHEVVRDRYFANNRNPSDSDYYLCGPPLMLQAVASMLHQVGVNPDQIFADDFGA